MSVTIVTKRNLGGSAAPAFVCTDPPEITGDAEEGATLTVTPGTYTPTPDGFLYQWYRDGVALEGETADEYEVVAADIMHDITCVETPQALVSGAPAVESNAIEPLPTYATWDPAVSGGGNFVFGGGNLAVTMSGVAHGSCKSTIGKTTGKHYWEVLCGPQNPTASIGAMKAGGDYSTCAGETGSLAAAIAAAIVRANGVPYPGGAVPTTPACVVGVLLDLDLGLIDFEIDGVSYGGGPNALGAWYTPGDTVHAACGAFGGNGPLVTANFGETEFEHSVPSGYRAGLY